MQLQVEGEEMGVTLVLIYIAGVLVSICVGRARAGLPIMSILSFSTLFTSPQWSLHQIGSIWLWPVFLIVWLVRGRPESPWQATMSPRGTLRVVRAR
jgi:K+-sensing histidine kinase KdpD